MLYSFPEKKNVHFAITLKSYHKLKIISIGYSSHPWLLIDSVSKKAYVNMGVFHWNKWNYENDTLCYFSSYMFFDALLIELQFWHM